MMHIILKAKTKDKAERKEEMEASERIIPENNDKKVEVGHVIIIPETEKKVNVTAVGKDGVTAQDEKGNKYLVRHENVVTENDQKENESDAENEQKEKIKISLDDKLNKKEHKKGTKFDTKEPHKKEKKKDEEENVENYLKKHYKQGDWLKPHDIAKLMDISIGKVEKELDELKERGIVQLQAESKTGDRLFKYIKAGRSKEEAKPNTYSKKPFDEKETNPKDREEDKGKSKRPNLKKLKPSEIWKKEEVKND